MSDGRVAAIILIVFILILASEPANTNWADRAPSREIANSGLFDGDDNGSSGSGATSSGNDRCRSTQWSTSDVRVRDDCVELLQTAMNELGNNAGTVDGLYGSNTRSAVVRFQRNNALTPDGVVGPRTTDAMCDVSNDSDLNADARRALQRYCG